MEDGASQCPKHFLAVAHDRLLLFTNAGSMVRCSTLTHKLLCQRWLQCIFSGISALTCNMYARRWTRNPCHLDLAPRKNVTYIFPYKHSPLPLVVQPVHTIHCPLGVSSIFFLIFVVYFITKSSCIDG